MNVTGSALKAALEAYFTVVSERSSNDVVTIVCPESGCGDSSGNRTFDLKAGVTNCWRCGNPTSGHAGRWLHLKGIEVEDIQGPSETTASLKEKFNRPLATNSKLANEGIWLPRGCRPLDSDVSHPIVQEISLMAQKKNLELSDFIQAKCHFTDAQFESKADWSQYCVFPVYEMGRLVYYQGRTYSMSKEGGPTKMFPSKAMVPSGSKFWVYNWDHASAPCVEVVIVVESILNVLSLRKALRSIGVDWAEPVAIFKHHLSQIQVDKLLLLGAPEICLMFDGDALSSAWSEAKKLVATKKVSIAEMPVGRDANDDVNLALDRFETRVKWSPALAAMAGFR